MSGLFTYLIRKKVEEDRKRVEEEAEKKVASALRQTRRQANEWARRNGTAGIPFPEEDLESEEQTAAPA